MKQKIALKRIENICSDINKLAGAQGFSLNQVNVLNIIFMVNKIFTGESERIGLSKKSDFEIFKKKSDKEKQESNE